MWLVFVRIYSRLYISFVGESSENILRDHPEGVSEHSFREKLRIAFLEVVNKFYQSFLLCVFQIDIFL